MTETPVRSQQENGAALEIKYVLELSCLLYVLTMIPFSFQQDNCEMFWMAHRGSIFRCPADVVRSVNGPGIRSPEAV